MLSMAPNWITLRIMRLASLAVLSLLLVAQRIEAQTANPAPTPRSEEHSGAPLLQFGVGPLTVTPTFRIGTLAVDTNVQYQRTRKPDFVASAGPGLDIALPFLDHWKLEVQGNSQYFYFHRTKQLRRWTGGGATSLRWATTGARASISTGVGREFTRPNFEVDARVALKQTNIAGSFERDLGRLTLALRADLGATRVEKGQEYRGADLFASLSTDRYNIEPRFHYRLTPLSSLIVEGTYAATSFPEAPARDFRQQSAGIGLMTRGFFKGQVTAGFRQNKLKSGIASKGQPYLRGDLAQQLGRRLTLKETYAHESSVSAFAVDGSLPTFERRALTVELTVQLASRVDLRLGGTVDKLKSDGQVRVVLDDGSIGRGKRDDLAYVTNADLGIRLSRARVAGFVSYTTRKSQFFSDFGIQGFQAGARVEYAPN